MCEPTTILAGTAAAAKVLGVKAQADQGKAQRRANLTQAEIRAEEQKDAAETQIGDRMKAARRERARAAVAAAEGGVGGQSFGLQIKQSKFDQDLDAGRIAHNLRTDLRATDAARRSADAQTAKPSPLDFITAGISGASSGLQLGKQIKTRKD